MSSKSKKLISPLSSYFGLNVFVYFVHVRGDEFSIHLCGVTYNQDVIYIKCIECYVFGLKKITRII
jgi:hypothetical protein